MVALAAHARRSIHGLRLADHQFERPPQSASHPGMRSFDGGAADVFGPGSGNSAAHSVVDREVTSTSSQDLWSLSVDASTNPISEVERSAKARRPLSARRMIDRAHRSDRSPAAKREALNISRSSVSLGHAAAGVESRPGDAHAASRPTARRSCGVPSSPTVGCCSRLLVAEGRKTRPPVM